MSSAAGGLPTVRWNEKFDGTITENNMGMFDYVNFHMDCPQCGKRLFGFQTKDTGCELETVEPDETQYFYTACPQCKAWVEFSRARPRLQQRDTPLTKEQLEAAGFTMKVKPNS